MKQNGEPEIYGKYISAQIAPVNYQKHFMSFHGYQDYFGNFRLTLYNGFNNKKKKNRKVAMNPCYCTPQIVGSVFKYYYFQ